MSHHRGLKATWSTNSGRSNQNTTVAACARKVQTANANEALQYNHYDLKYRGLVLPHIFFDITLIELTHSISLDKFLMIHIQLHNQLEISDEISKQTRIF